MDKEKKIVRTGYMGLDDIGFLKFNEVSLIAGRPFVGKTFLAMNIAANIARENQKVCFVSFESTKKDCIERLMKINGVDESYLSNVIIFDNSYKMDSPNEIARAVKKECEDAALVIIDYLQLIPKGAECFRDDLLGGFMALFAIRPAILLLSETSRAIDKRDDKHLHTKDVPSAMEFMPYIDNLAMLYRIAYYDYDQSKNDDMEVSILKGEKAPARVMLKFNSDAHTIVDKDAKEQAFIKGISIGLDCGETDDEFTPDILLLSPPGELNSKYNPYEYEILTRNGSKCYMRLIELFKNYDEKGYISTTLSKASITSFFGWGNNDISFQEYEGSFNEEAIKTFFKHGYCFISDIPYDNKYMIWACGEDLETFVKECITETTKGDVAEIIIQSSESNQVKLNDKVRISVWRIREGF